MMEDPFQHKNSTLAFIKEDKRVSLKTFVITNYMV